MAAMRTRPDFFDDASASFFGVSNDVADEREGRVADSYPGFRFFWDFDFAIADLYGARDPDAPPQEITPLRRRWVILDPTLHVVRVVPFEEDRSDIDKVLAIIDGLPPVERHMGFVLPPPVLFLRDVFEPEFCRLLIDLYEQDGGAESGFMRDQDGKTVAVMDHGHKRRRDTIITDARLIAAAQQRIARRILPEIAKVHQYQATRMERYIVSCYSSEDGGHFRPHRDNTTMGTAHRRFAVSVNLNGDFEGGEISFPEYGATGYKMPPGGAVVFSCSLLHAVSKVTAGQRYAFLPFLYDESAAAIREANNAHLGDNVGAYQPGIE